MVYSSKTSLIIPSTHTSELDGLGTMAPTFEEYTTFSADCGQNPNCQVPTWPMLAVIPPGVTTAVAADLECYDLAMPMSAVFTAGPACGSGDFDGGGLGMSDIPLFVDALLASNPSPEIVCTGDINDDKAMDGRDIQLFVNILLGR